MRHGRQMNPALQKGCQQKADADRPHDRLDSPRRIRKASRKGCCHTGYRLDLIDQRIGAQQIIPMVQLGHAGLHGGRFKGAQNSQHDLQARDGSHSAPRLQKTDAEENSNRRKGIQPGHQPAAIHPIRQDVAQW